MANAELGKFINPKHGISIPLYFNFSKQIGTTEYNLFQGNILLKETLKDLSEYGKDSLMQIIQNFTLRKTLVLSIRVRYSDLRKNN